ncbi:hypothetical protein LCGC14_2886490 [marine sediment metagenome]|uniref:DUF4398 domain-containing protein n=1 Tax=marine sediment metagenome TaxID=412755 RepID=A0A0F9APM4_9ZZZZ
MQSLINYRSFILAFFMMFAMVTLQSCASLGYEDIDTTRKAIVVANAEVRAANFLLQDLIARRAISKKDAGRALQSLQTAKNNLQSALNAVDVSGDPVLAGSKLERANISISVALRLLAPLVEN